MSNNYFQFKEFRIEQGDCGMKVTTEACVFATLIQNNFNSPVQVLDIGAGTGLISLMLAQRFKEVQIDSVEIDDVAAHQAMVNIENSPWSTRIKLHTQSIQNFTTTIRKKYELIVSNPPFYANHQKSANQRKAIALHTSTLTHQELFRSVDLLLADKGEFQVLLPEYEASQLTELFLNEGFFLVNSIAVYNSTRKQTIFRVINTFSRQVQSQKNSKFYIRNHINDYTDLFISLLKPFYLHLD